MVWRIGGGVGRLVADWIIHGKSDMDITGMNIDRLHTYQVIFFLKLNFRHSNVPCLFSDSKLNITVAAFELPFVVSLLRITHSIAKTAW